MQVSTINNHNPKFSGRRNTFIDDFTNTADSYMRNSEDIADVFWAAKSAIDTPEEVSVKLLTNQLNNLANKEKTPKPVKNGIKYVSAILTGGLTFYAAKKVPAGITKMLSKFKLGQSIVNAGASLKGHISVWQKSLKKDFPKTSKTLGTVKEYLFIDKWAKDGLIKNIVAGTLAISSGKKVLDKYNSAVTEKQKTESIENEAKKDAA